MTSHIVVVPNVGETTLIGARSHVLIGALQCSPRVIQDELTSPTRLTCFAAFYSSSGVHTLERSRIDCWYLVGSTNALLPLDTVYLDTCVPLPVYSNAT